MNRVIISGSRNIKDYAIVKEFVERCIGNLNPVEIVSGGAEGVDELGETFAYLHKLPLTIFEAEWDKYGKSAGPIRNEKMAQYAKYCIVIWDGTSPGSRNMIAVAKKYNLNLREKIIAPPIQQSRTY